MINDILKKINADLVCPKCRNKIELDIASLRNNKIHCPNCNEEFDKEAIQNFYRQEKLSGGSEGDANSKDYFLNNGKAEIVNNDEEFKFVIKPVGFSFQVVFLLFFMFIWGGGVFAFSVFFVYSISKGEMPIYLLLFMFPFWGVLCYFIYGMLFSLRGTVILYAENGYFNYCRELFGRKKIKSYPIASLINAKVDYFTGKNGSRTYFARIYLDNKKNFRVTTTGISPLSKEMIAVVVDNLNKFILNKEKFIDSTTAQNQADIIENNVGKEEKIEYVTSEEDLESSKIKLKWIFFSVMIGFPVIFLLDAGLIPFFTVIPLFLAFGLLVALLSPGKTLFEPILGVFILVALSFIITSILSNSPSSGYNGSFFENWSAFGENISIKGFMSRNDTKEGDILRLLKIHLIILAAGSVLSFIGAFFGEKWQEYNRRNKVI
ncbi:MAG: hypothetical protein KA885_01100 [Spirochaetes bacterium]|nr:hypothetical protein [Spirochaetota bacterium]